MVTIIISHKICLLGGSYACKPPPFLSFLSVQTVCQDGGDEADDEDQQVGCPLTEYQSNSHKH